MAAYKNNDGFKNLDDSDSLESWNKKFLTSVLKRRVSRSVFSISRTLTVCHRNAFKSVFLEQVRTLKTTRRDAVMTDNGWLCWFRRVFQRHSKNLLHA